jgi:DNA polymerase I-like protein with 3'-5' exonuclease and polymerase domains
VAASGTADRAYHVEGAQKTIEKRLSKIKQLSKNLIAFADRNGYVETMPDKTVDPERGYPLLCYKTNWGKVLPTIPLSYHVQGTAMWWMQKAMVRCQEFLDEYNESKSKDQWVYIIAQIHDELLFDFPKDHPKWVVDKLRELMELGGNDIGIPTPVNVEYHPVCWSECESF